MRGKSVTEQVVEAAEALGLRDKLEPIMRGGIRAEVTAAFEVFLEHVEARPRELVKECHPDRPGGGDLDRMQRANAARDLLRKIELNPRRRPDPTPKRPPTATHTRTVIREGVRVRIQYAYGTFPPESLYGEPPGFWQRGIERAERMRQEQIRRGGTGGDSTTTATTESGATGSGWPPSGGKIN